MLYQVQTTTQLSKSKRIRCRKCSSKRLKVSLHWLLDRELPTKKVDWLDIPMRRSQRRQRKEPGHEDVDEVRTAEVTWVDVKIQRLILAVTVVWATAGPLGQRL